MAIPGKSVLLDTSVVVRHFRDGNALVSHLAAFEELYLPQAALAELYAGAFRSARPEKNLQQIQRFLEAVDVLLPDESTPGETHVAGERKLATDTGCTAANRNDRNDRTTTQPHKHVGKRLQTRPARRKSRRIRKLRQEVVVRQEKSIDGTVKDNNLNLLVNFQRCDDLVELRNSFRAKDVEGRVIKRHAPIRRRSSRKNNLFNHRRVWRPARSGVGIGGVLRLFEAHGEAPYN